MPDPESKPPAQAAPSRKALNRLLDRIPLAPRIVFYALFFLAMLLVVLPMGAHALVNWLAPSWQVELPLWARIAGGIYLGVMFVIYILSSHLLTSRGKGGYVEFDPPSEFVATGPYRWCRNPVAGSAVAMLLGLSVACSSVGVLLLFVVAIIFAHCQVVFLEEPLLKKRFGASYEAYLRRVPRWCPRPPKGSGE